MGWVLLNRSEDRGDPSNRAIHANFSSRLNYITHFHSLNFASLPEEPKVDIKKAEQEVGLLKNALTRAN